MAGGESFWHLDMKQRHIADGFDVEQRIDMPDGRSFRFDAYRTSNVHQRPIREFVHSLSASYVPKSNALHAENLSRFVIWIFDGNAFVSDRRKPIRGNGYKKLLKPAAWDIAHDLAMNGQEVVLDWRGGYRLWTKKLVNVWYPLDAASYLRPLLTG